MKLSECIQEVRQEKPNSFSEDALTGFINELEAMVQHYLGKEAGDFVVYAWGDNGNDELMVKHPHDVMYKSYLKAKIDYANEEYQSYQNNQAQFSADYAEWQAHALSRGEVKSNVPTGIKNWW